MPDPSLSEVDGEDDGGLAALTGYAIGDQVDPNRPAPWSGADPRDIPEWFAVSLDGIVVGYQHNLPLETLITDPNRDEHPELIIYAADGVTEIGRFLDGVVVLNEKEGQ